MKAITGDFLRCIGLFVVGLVIACLLFGCATKPNPGICLPPNNEEPGYSTF